MDDLCTPCSSSYVGVEKGKEHILFPTFAAANKSVVKKHNDYMKDAYVDWKERYAAGATERAAEEAAGIITFKAELVMRSGHRTHGKVIELAA